MPTVHRERGARHHHHWLGAVHRAVAVMAAMFLIAELAVVAASTVRPGQAQAAIAPPGAGFTLNASDLKFILKQIKIAEHHAITESGPGAAARRSRRVPDRQPDAPVRAADGRRLGEQPPARPEHLRRGGPEVPAPDRPGVPGRRGLRRARSARPGRRPTSRRRGAVIDSQPRVISNLIVDQTATNPAAIEAAGNPHRTFLGEPARPCTSENPNVPEGCTPAHETLFIPNVTTDVGLSPPYNSWFTLFGQFFDHGVDLTQKSGGTVFVPLKADDPLIAGPDHSRRQRRRPAGRAALHGADAGEEPARSRRHPRQRRRRAERDEHRHALGRPEPDLHVALRPPGLPARVRQQQCRQARRQRQDAARRRRRHGDVGEGQVAGRDDARVQARGHRRRQRPAGRRRPVRALPARRRTGSRRSSPPTGTVEGNPAAPVAHPGQRQAHRPRVPRRHRPPRGADGRPRRQPDDAGQREARPGRPTRGPATTASGRRTTTRCSTRTSSPATAASTRTSASAPSTRSSTPSTTGWSTTSSS